MSFRLSGASALGVTLLLGCASERAVDPAVARVTGSQTMSMDAVVHFASTVEGGCWVLDSSNGRYEPVDLPRRFQVDGVAVHVVLSEASGWASTCMMGPLVHVERIRAS